jgi:hypothetical protein
MAKTNTKSYLDKWGKAKDDLNDIGSTPVGKVLTEFIQNQITEMKSELSSRRATGSLAQSITFQFKTGENGISAEILMNDYWDFINSGVDGISQKGHARTNVYGQAYSFKTAFPSAKMIDSFTGTGSLRGWMATKGITSITYTNADGEEITKQLSTDSDFRGAAYVLARATKQKGIKPTPFVDNVFTDEAIEQLQEDIFKAFESML